MTNSEIKKIFDLQLSNRAKLAESTASDRKIKLKKLLHYILKHSEEIQKAVYSDFKKPSAEVKLTEIFAVTSELKHTIRNLSKWMKPKRVGMPLTFFGSSAKIYYEPKGISLIIAPWNFPFQLLVGPFVSAIAAGCPVILKPSEYSPNTSKFLKNMISELFNEDEAFLIEGESDISKYLTTLPFDHIFFTGSTAVGKLIMQEASKNLTSVTLELGGKSPCIVAEDYDLKNAARRIVWGKFMNAGQTCVAPDYILINKNYQQKFISFMKEAIDKYTNKNQQDYEYTQIINKAHLERLKFRLNECIENGAKLEIGSQFDEKSNFMEFTVLSNVTSDSPIMKEEIFGPILPILTYESLDEIEEIISKNPNPLALYVFSNNKKLIDRIKTRIKSGALSINEVVVHFSHPNLPFGGVNQSGLGKAHGKYGFESFSNAKSIFKQPKYSANLLFYPPYTKRVNKLIDLLIKYL